MADEDSLRRLWRYKSDLEQEPDEEKLLEILGRLRRLPVSISALQETGIGKLVNSFRKREGVVGELARKVVSSWKAVVEKEVQSSRHRSPSLSPQNHGNSSCDEDEKNRSDNESDADSWNSYKDESSQDSRSNEKKSETSFNRKRKLSTDSDVNEEQAHRSSRVKEVKRPIKTEHIKVEPPDDYTVTQGKKYKTESGGLSKSETHSKVSSHTVMPKKDGGKHSSDTHSNKELHSKSSGQKEGEGRTKSSNSYHSGSEKGDRQTERTTIDRRQKRHSVSSSNEDEEQASDNNQNNSLSAKSSSHKHSSASNSHKHPSSSSSHKHPSSSSSHKHSSFSSSHKHSSSSSSHKHSSSSSSHKHSSSSSSHKHSSVSNSHKHSSTSGSQKHSSSSNSHQHSSSSSSHKHPSSSSSHKHSSSSSHKHSSSKTSNHGTSSSAISHHRSSSSSVHQINAPESLSPEPLPSSSKTLSSNSSTSKRESGSSSTQALSSNCHMTSDQSEDEESHDASSSSQKDNRHQHSSHSWHQATPSCRVMEDTSLSSQKEKSSSSKEKPLSKHSSSHSHKKDDVSSNHPTSSRLSEREKSGKKSHLSAHQQNSSSPVPSSDQSGFSISSSTVYIKEEKHSPHREQHQISSTSAQTSKQAPEAKSRSSKKSKLKSGSSDHKKSKPSVEEPDLFSDTLCIKAEPSSPVHKSKNFKQKPSESSRTSTSISQKPGPSSHNLPSETTIKSEKQSVSDQKLSSPNSSDLKDVIKQENDEDYDSSKEQKKSKHEKERGAKSKKRESPVKDENMSFEDFMTFDEAALVKKGKSSLKPATKSSSSSSSKSNHSKPDKLPGSKWSSSLVDLPSSSKATFSVPAPSNNVTVTELDILSMLPETQANYKPLRYNPHYKDEEAEHSPQPLVDPDIIGTKSVTRTHVYSGRKHGVTEVKPLFDLCMQVLIDNIDAIDCVGGIPYTILKPVLERCSAQQLYQLEDFNPHFLEDSDELWEILCQRDFRTSKPQEMETWRELYMRRFEERELKYQKLKQCMSSSIAKGQGGRKAQLAYVDTVAKPPREVLRKQKQFGTGCIVSTKNNPNIKGSSSGLKAYRPSTIVPAHDPMNDRSRMMRPMPPMMAKSLQMRKNMRR